MSTDHRTVDDATLDGVAEGTADVGPTSVQRLALLLAWSKLEPDRIGEVVLIPPGPVIVIGRGGVELDKGELTGLPTRQRPGVNETCGPLEDPTISRKQLAVTVLSSDVLHVRNVGRCPLFIDGRAQQQGELRPGSLLRLGTRMLFLCVRRPSHFAAAPSWPADATPLFGLPDSNGLVGESPVVWTLRDQVGFIARRPHHVLILGDSGVGKELVARAIHEMSSRGRRRPLVSRNAATIPEGLVDAELFGNVRGYPNPGMAERPGLIGEAHGSTLFLDELGELPEKLQAHLLRVLDAGGEYQRLGDARRLSSDFRLVSATNRSLSELRHDLVPRLTMRIAISGLNERRGDIPLLIRHMLNRAADQDREVALRFTDLSTGRVRVDLALVEALISHRYTHHVRQLEGLLWRAIATSTGDHIALTADVLAELDLGAPEETGPTPLPDEETVRVAMERHAGVQERVWRELGLNNRFVLRRLLKKYGLSG